MNKIENYKIADGKYKCPYCSKVYKKKGVSTHIWRTHEEGQQHNPNKNRVAWNKGLSKEIDARVQNHANDLKKKFEKGILKPSFLNKQHTEETKAKMSLKASGNNRGGKCKWFKVEKCNKEVVVVQGTWELRFSKVLEVIDKSWIKITLSHPEHSFKWKDSEGIEHTYTPDFYSPALDKYYEVKGYWWGKDKEKMKLVLQQHKELNLEIVMKKELLDYESKYLEQ